MLVITITKCWMPAANTQLQNLIKITEVRKGSNYEHQWRFKVSLVSFSNQRPYVVWLTVAAQCFQIARVANFPTSFSFCSCITMDGNPAFAVHATAHAFLRAAINFNSMLLRQQIWCLGNYLIFDGLTNFVLKWIWCGSEGNYDDFYLWDV